MFGPEFWWLLQSLRSSKEESSFVLPPISPVTASSAPGPQLVCGACSQLSVTFELDKLNIKSHKDLVTAATTKRVAL